MAVVSTFGNYNLNPTHFHSSDKTDDGRVHLEFKRHGHEKTSISIEYKSETVKYNIVWNLTDEEIKMLRRFLK